MSDTQLQWLVDRAEISDVLHRYATAVDLRDWALLRRCFTDEMEADFRTFGLRDAYRGPADGWVAAVRSTIDGCEATQHTSSNHSHQIDGDRAICTSYVRADHFLKNELGDDRYTVGGYYTHDLVRTDQGWRIAKYVLTVTWHQGNRHILKLATRRASSAAGASES